jgi:hypothetical protein
VCFTAALLSEAIIMHFEWAFIVFMPPMMDFDPFSNDMHEG